MLLKAILYRAYVILIVALFCEAHKKPKKNCLNCKFT